MLKSKKLWLRSLSLILALVMVMSITSQGYARGVKVQVGSVPISFDVLYASDGTRIERGQIGNTYFESRINKNQIITTIRTGSKVEVVAVDLDSPFFTITTNGVASIHDRRDYLTNHKTFKQPAPFTEWGKVRDPLSTAMITDCNVGSLNKANLIIKNKAAIDSVFSISLDEIFGRPYFDKWIGTRISHSPIRTTAVAYEDYFHFTTEHTTILVEAGRGIALLLGILTMGWGTIIKVAASAIVVLAGGTVIWDAFTVEKNAVQQNWTRRIYITQDPNNWRWYWAAREVVSEMVVGPSGFDLKQVSENKHWDFDDISGLLQTGINNYRRFMGVF